MIVRQPSRPYANEEVRGGFNEELAFYELIQQVRIRRERVIAHSTAWEACLKNLPELANDARCISYAANGIESFTDPNR